MDIGDPTFGGQLVPYVITAAVCVAVGASALLIVNGFKQLFGPGQLQQLLPRQQTEVMRGMTRYELANTADQECGE